jgi:S-methylmethionine-dependent homocysteine/selenocysteine methylase
MTALGDDLRRRLAGGDVIVLDGGMGTEIQARGVPMDGEAWSALANVDHPEVVCGIHEDFIRAGAEVVIANTFPAGLGALTAAGMPERVVEINKAAVAVAQRARARTGGSRVAVAGSMSDMALAGLSGAGADATSPLEAFRVQANALAEAGVDLLVLEMMRSAAVAEPALLAAAETGLPVWFGVSLAELRPTGALVTIDGGEVTGLLELAEGRADAVMIMHTDVDLAGRALPIVDRAWSGPVGAYPHVGDWTPPNWVFDTISPAAFAGLVAPWVDDGARVLGGCCGIRPSHIAALREALAKAPAAG